MSATLKSLGEVTTVRRALLIVVFAVLVFGAHAPASAQPPQRRDPRLLPVLYTHPEAERVEVRRDITYKTAGATELKFNLYTPPGTPAGARLPVVIFINGVGDPVNGPKFKDWGQYTSWPRLVAAATGFAAVAYDARSTGVTYDTYDLIKHVRDNAAALKIDPDRIGLWSCSANVLLGLPLAMDETRKYLRGAVFYYGVMNDHPTRNDLPLFVARAGNDDANLNQSIDTFVRASISDDVPITFVNYVEGQHGFELLDDAERSREIVRQTLDFLRFNLTRDVAAEEAARRRLSPPKFLKLVTSQGIQKAVQEFEAARKTDPENNLFAEQTVNQLGYQLLQQGRAKDAIEVFKLNVAHFPQSANTYDSLSDAYEADGQNALALQLAEKALELLAAQTGLDEAFRNNIKTSAEGKIQRLKTASKP